MAEKVTGDVVWFNDQKGYGFIKIPNRTGDLFVHYSGITTETNGRKTLEKDQQVELEITQGQNGPQASNVVILK